MKAFDCSNNWTVARCELRQNAVVHGGCVPFLRFNVLHQTLLHVQQEVDVAVVAPGNSHSILVASCSCTAWTTTGLTCRHIVRIMLVFRDMSSLQLEWYHPLRTPPRTQLNLMTHAHCYWKTDLSDWKSTFPACRIQP